ncbi:methyltransferase domain-containing protein [Candidatus Bathyarchaeota archaeon]|nr:MAG: methyltransferase domain-containing protein [Candidatus Bathyarchaeota archaeon]
MKSEDASKRIAEDFDEKACEFCDRYKESGLSASSKILLGFLTDDGIRGKSLLDLGCGAGAFTLEALKAGATNTVGMDLSAVMIKTASDLAGSSGFGAVAMFQVGNAAETDLPACDIVVLDKVICCYPDFSKLLGNAGGASRESLAFVIPRNAGLIGLFLRPGAWLMNLFEKRRKGSLFYMHSLDRIDAVLKSHGFEQSRRKASRIWLAFLYHRAHTPT